MREASHDAELWRSSTARLRESGAEEPFDRVTRLVSSLLGVPMSYVNLVDEDVVVLKSGHGLGAEAGGRDPVGRSLCGLVLSQDGGAAAQVPDTVDDRRTRDLPAVVELGVRAWAGHPVRRPDGEVVGTLCAMDTSPRAWSDEDCEVLAALSRAVAGEIGLRVALEAAQAGRRESERQARQARRHAAAVSELAETLRESLLPARLPEVPGLEIGARHRAGGDPAREISVLGDFYDVFPTPTGWGVVVGDVCGHGPTAARATALARSTVRALGHTDDDPGAVLETLHGVLHVWFERPGFVTAAYAVLRPEPSGRTRVELAGAGHPPVVLWRADGTTEALDPGGRALGITSASRVGRAGTTLGPGDSLVLLTDGITEARPPRGPQFEIEGVYRLLASRGPGADPSTVATALVDAAVQHARSTGNGAALDDDAAVVVVRTSAR